MKILVLSFYYFPDLCAGSFRCSAFVEQLKQLIDEHGSIDVMTTVPNRYSSFNAQAPELEYQGRVKIQRVSLPSHHSGMVDQAKAFAHFSREVNKRMSHQDYDLVFATSSRLMTAALGAWVAYRTKTKLYLDIRDIFVDTLHDVLPLKMSLFLKPVFSLIEKWAIAQADRVNLVSRGFENYFNVRYPNVKLRWFTNGIDPEFLDLNIETAKQSQAEPLTVLYAGNIGEGQGLHRIIPLLAKAMEGRVNFKLVGDGGRKAQLEAALQETLCQNVELLSPLPRSQLISEYQQADILFLHLNDYDAFRKVLLFHVLRP